MNNFWVMFATQEALAVASAFLQTAKNLTPAQKAAGEQFLLAGSAFAASFSAGSPIGG